MSPLPFSPVVPVLRRRLAVAATDSGGVITSDDAPYPTITGDYWDGLQAADNSNRFSNADGDHVLDGIVTTQGPTALVGHIQGKSEVDEHMVEATNPTLTSYPTFTGDYWDGHALTDNSNRFTVGSGLITAFDLASSGKTGEVRWEDDEYRGNRLLALDS